VRAFWPFGSAKEENAALFDPLRCYWCHFPPRKPYPRHIDDGEVFVFRACGRLARELGQRCIRRRSPVGSRCLGL